MNLIEQLGGYERANSKLLKMDKILKEVYYSHSDAQKANELRQALLEYRRQHNIFEVGDICKLKIKHDFGLYKFQRIDGDRIYLEDRLGFAEFGINKGVVEHATDEEIKAGKRLEVV